LYVVRRLSSIPSTPWNVRFVNDVPRAQLAAEFNRCQVFCFPSVQEGFGVV
jgi:glycosyltransferase involved in cell wall biosynthesis